MQIAYIKALNSIMQSDKRVVSLLSDSGTDYDAMMARDMPYQCFNVGIAEQNQIGIAAGMAMSGKIPFVYTSGAFLAYRGYEFIRNDVCYQNLNVKLVGMGSGLSWSTLGPSHHTTEDISVLRSLPGLAILSPATPIEAAACVVEAYHHVGPTYIRLGMSGEEEFFHEGYSVHIGGSERLTQGDTAAIFSTGSMLSEVMQAEALLAQKGCSVSVYNIYSLKPLDSETMLNAARRHKAIVTVEEHTILGGLGGAVAEILLEAGLSLPFLRIGLPDTFAVGYGTQSDVRRQNGLDGETIAERVYGFLQTSERHDE